MASSYGEDASKSALRNGYDLLCKRLPKGQEGMVRRDIFSHLMGYGPFRAAKVVLAYLPFREELDTSELLERLWKAGRAVALPRHVEGAGTLEFCLVSGWDDLTYAHGAREPKAALPALSAVELRDSVCLVPGLVFDGEGHRIGYGAGFYDNFLATYPGLKLGLVRGLQISSNPLPSDEHDVAVDVLISDSVIWNCRR